MHAERFCESWRTLVVLRPGRASGRRPRGPAHDEVRKRSPGPGLPQGPLARNQPLVRDPQRHLDASAVLYRCSTSPSSTSMAASSAADGIVHREGPSSRTRKRSQVSPGYRSQCRLGTGAASAKCRAGTGARVSPSYRDCTRHVVAKLEREKGFEPTTLCLGSRGSTARVAPPPNDLMLNFFSTLRLANRGSNACFRRRAE